jgi:hypothetical protein
MKKIINIAIVLFCILACTSCSKECQEGVLFVIITDNQGNPINRYEEPRNCLLSRQGQWEVNHCGCTLPSNIASDGYYRQCFWN